MFLILQESFGMGLGLVGIRNIGSKIGPLIVESLVATTVAIVNILAIVLIFSGRRTLFKNNFYIIVANLILLTSMKTFVELAFVIPYYAGQTDGKIRVLGFFSSTYEFIIFNISVFADYGILFFSLLIAINRCLSEKLVKRFPRIDTHSFCPLVWLCSSVIPIMFFICKCQYRYSINHQQYYNECDVESPLIRILLDCLIYLSYFVAVVIFGMYAYTFIHSQRISKDSSEKRTRIQLNLLQQSAVIFALYAVSILCVVVLPFINEYSRSIDFSDIAYAENLLNLSIAAVYPFCLIFMSGELRSVLIAKIAPRPQSRVASISINNPHPIVTTRDLLNS